MLISQTCPGFFVGVPRRMRQDRYDKASRRLSCGYWPPGRCPTMPWSLQHFRRCTALWAIDEPALERCRCHDSFLPQPVNNHDRVDYIAATICIREANHFVSVERKERNLLSIIIHFRGIGVQRQETVRIV